MDEKKKDLMLGFLVGVITITSVFVYFFYEALVHPARTLFHWLFW